MNIYSDGVRYRNFTEAKVQIRMGTLARRFVFTAATRGIKDVPFYCGMPIQIWDDNDRLLTGYIEKMTMQSNGKGHSYVLEGRDLIGDVVDSNLPRIAKMTAPLPQLCEFVLNYLGIKANVIDEALTGKRPFKTVIAADPTETAGEFLATQARRKQVLLQSDGFGNIVITAAGGRKVDRQLINRIDGVGNNMLSASLTVDHSQRYGRYSTELQINMSMVSKANLNTRPELIVAERFQTVDDSIRQSRVRTTAADYNLGKDEAKLRNLWEIALNRAEAVKYSVTVPGFRDSVNNNLWEVNTLPTVTDEYNGIKSDRMLIAQIEHVFNQDGKTTNLLLTDKDAFKTELKIRTEIDIDGRNQT